MTFRQRFNLARACVCFWLFWPVTLLPHALAASRVVEWLYRPIFGYASYWAMRHNPNIRDTIIRYERMAALGIEDNDQLVVAPWPMWVVDALDEWQACGWAHQLTCAGGNDGQTCASGQQVTMRPTKDGLVCPECGRVQDWVPAMCLTLPPNPAVLLATANEESPQ